MGTNAKSIDVKEALIGKKVRVFALEEALLEKGVTAVITGFNNQLATIETDSTGYVRYPVVLIVRLESPISYRDYVIKHEISVRELILFVYDAQDLAALFIEGQVTSPSIVAYAPIRNKTLDDPTWSFDDMHIAAKDVYLMRLPSE